MIHTTPPLEDDEDAYILIDHREEESFIVSAVSEYLAVEHQLEVQESDEEMSVLYQGVAYPIPLQFTPFDRYIMISSLAYLLREHYRFFLLKASLDSDTHGLLVAREADVSAWGEVPDHLVPLELGLDYFNGFRVPYLGGEDTAPDFEQDSQRVQDEGAVMEGYVHALLSGKMDDATATKLAALMAKDASLEDSAEGASEAELAAELKKNFAEALQAPDVVESRQEMNDALNELRSLVGKPAKPWWKFW